MARNFYWADATLLNSEHGGIWAGAEELRKEYWANTPEERRKRLFPFLWETVATQGTLYGNQTKGSVAHVTNGQAFSYPGYNEMLTGTPDPPNRQERIWTKPKRHRLRMAQSES